MVSVRGRPASTAVLLLALALAGAASSARAEDLEAQARQLLDQYEEKRQVPEWRGRQIRWGILRRLGRLDTPSAREGMFAIFQRHQRSPRYKRFGDGVVALLEVGPILDAEYTRLFVERVARRPGAVHLQTLADSLAGVTRSDARAWLAADGLAQKDDEVLGALVDALAGVAIPEAAGRLRAIYEAHASERGNVDLAYGAVRALGRIGGTEVRDVLRAAARHAEWRIRLAAADVLPGQAGLESADVDLLRALLRDEHGVVRRAAAQASGAAGLEAVTRDLAYLLEAPRLRTRRVAHDALLQVAGQDLGWTPEPWHRWAQRSGDAESSFAEAKPYAFGTYYGFDLLTDRVVFLVDMSASMAWPWREFHPKRYVAARKELRRALGGLAPETHFNLLVFEDHVRAWKRHMTPADEKSLASALKWMERTFDRPSGDTNTHGVLEQAFEDNPEADTIFLLSDGAPNGGEFDDPASIVALVKRWNRYRRTAVNTITLTLDSLDRGVPHLGQSPYEVQRFMKALAEATGGAYELVERPPAWMKEGTDDDEGRRK